MKDFYGNYYNVNPKLDFTHQVTIIENRASGDEISRYFTPNKDGVIFLMLRTVKDSYMYAQLKDGAVLGSLCWTAQQTSIKDLRSIIPINKNQEIHCWGKWCDFNFVPYL
jgi:hypothetical protein